MARTFRCPSCGASLDYDGDDDLAVTCAYCSSTVLVPEELRPDRQTAPTSIPPFGAPMTLNLGGLTGTIATLKSVRDLARSGRQEEAAVLFSDAFGIGRQEADALVARLASGEGVAVSNTDFGLPLRVVTGIPSTLSTGYAGSRIAEVLLDQAGIGRRIRRQVRIVVAIVVLAVLVTLFLSLSGTVSRFL